MFRTRDAVTCGSSDIAEKEAAKAAKDGIQSGVIDLTLDSDSDSDIIVSPPTPPIAGPSKIGVRKSKPTPTNVSRETTRSASSTSARSKHKLSIPHQKAAATDVGPWTCGICTLINDAFALRCAACDGHPPRDPAIGWVCLDCGTENEQKLWMCTTCGTIKSES